MTIVIYMQFVLGLDEKILMYEILIEIVGTLFF